MKQSQARSTDQQNSQKEYNINRTHRLKKFRQARKSKGTCGSQNGTQDHKAINREQKMEIKKLRNREAAQRARDKAKVHVDNLEAELQILKDQIVLLKSRQYICYKCQQSCSVTQPVEQTKSMDMKEEVFFQEENIEQLQPLYEVQRVRNSKSFSLSMFLMVLTIIVCVVVGLKQDEIQTKRPHRLLQQIVNVSNDGSFENMKTNVYPHKEHHHHHIQDLHHVSFSEQKNIKQINQFNNSRLNIDHHHQNKGDLKHKTISSNISSKINPKIIISEDHIINDKKYDVLFCDSSRIYQSQLNKSSFLQGQFKLIIDATNLHNYQINSQNKISQAFELLAKTIKSPSNNEQQP